MANAVYDWYTNDVAPQHHNFFKRNQQMYWSGTDREQDFDQNIQNPERRQLLEKFGFDTKDSIVYAYNNHGFREVDFDNRPAVLAFGCSFTEGTGVRVEQSWSKVLEKKLGLHVWNLGLAGSALDTIYRLVEYYAPKLNTRLVIVQSPPQSRLEYCDIYGKFRVVQSRNLGPHEHFIREWITQTLNQEINFQKNRLAIRQMCNDLDVPLIFDKTYERREEIPKLARDFQHAGIEAHEELAEKFYRQIQLQGLLKN